MPENKPENAQLVASIGGQQQSFDLPVEAVAGPEPDVEAILRAIINQLTEVDDAEREELIRRYITDWEEPQDDS